jgi:polyisoprenyl-teichoic acid--peptidoglycan teichoic acid transferase
MSYLPRDDEPARGRRTERARNTSRARLGRFFGATALGTVVPGLGLTLTGRRRSGVTLIVLFLGGLAALTVLLVRNGVVRTALDLAVRPNVLVAASVAVVAGAVIWCASIVWTARGARPEHLSRSQRWATSAFTVLMCLLVLAPTVQVVRYVTIQRDVIGSLFTTGKHVAPSAAGVNQAHPNSAMADPWAGTPRVNVLLLGSDAGADRTGVRTDSMMVASINTRTGDTVLFGVPRNLQNVPFPEHDPLHKLFPQGYNCGPECLMNAVWTLAEEHRNLFPGDSNPGLTATRDALSSVLGLGIDYTTIIDLNGFRSLVNAMGGVDVNVRERIPIGGHVNPGGTISGITGWINAGPQHLDGYHALWFSRSRATTDDFSRMRRQRCMVGALVDQVNPVTMLEKYPALAAVAKNNIQSDIAQDELPAFVELVQRMQKGSITSLALTNKNTNVGNPDYAKLHALVQSAIATPHPAPSHPATATPSTPTPTPTPSATASVAPATDDLVSIKDAC